MPIENMAPNPESNRTSTSPRWLSRWFGFRTSIIVGTIGFVLSFILVIVAYATADKQHELPYLVVLVMSLGLLGVALLYAPMLEPETFPAFLAKRLRVMAGFTVVGGLLLVATVVMMTLVPFSLSPTSVIVGTLLSIICIGLASYAAREILAPVRRAERERRQKLITTIEAFAEEDPKLYAVAQLVRDDIAISSRQSGRQSFLQNTLFFLAGLAIPLVIRYVVPYIQGWLNLK
jgi:hypothetical protein